MKNWYLNVIFDSFYDNIHGMVTAAHLVCVLRGLTHTDTESRAPGWDQSLVTTYRSPWFWRSHKHFPANKRKYFRLWLHVMSRVQCHVQMLRMFRLRLSLWTRWRWIMSEQAKYSMNLYRGILLEESSFLLHASAHSTHASTHASHAPTAVVSNHVLESENWEFNIMMKTESKTLLKALVFIRYMIF